MSPFMSQSLNILLIVPSPLCVQQHENALKRTSRVLRLHMLIQKLRSNFCQPFGWAILLLFTISSKVGQYPAWKTYATSAIIRVTKTANIFDANNGEPLAFATLCVMIIRLQAEQANMMAHEQVGLGNYIRPSDSCGGAACGFQNILVIQKRADALV